MTPEEKEQKRKEILAQLLEVETKKKQYRQDNRIEFFNTPVMPANPLQAELLEAWDERRNKIFTYTGANRIGKTTILAIISISLMIGKWPWDGKKIWFPHNYPRKLRIVGQDWEKHIKTVLTPEIAKWWPRNRPMTPKKNQVGAVALYTDEITKSTLEIMSNKQETELHEGWSGDFIGYDEPPRRGIRVANARGLIDRLGRELFCMTLLKEAWVDREVIKARTDDGAPDTSVYNIHGDISSNVGYGITQEGVDQFAKTLTADEEDARLKGIPSYMSGLVYPKFSRKAHLVERFTIPLDWVVDIAIDIHPREKQAVLFIATDSRNERYCCDEIWDHGDGKWVAEEIVRKIKRNAYRVSSIIIDPLAKSDSNNDDTTFGKVASVLSQNGLVLQVASKDKDSGILDVKDHLVGPNKKPSMFFFDDLIRTIMEIEGYMWDEETQKAAKKDDHMMENLYRLCLLDTQYVSPDDDYSETYDEDEIGGGRHTAY